MDFHEKEMPYFLRTKAIKFERECGYRSQSIWQHYKTIRNACTSLFHKSKSSYFKKICESTSISSKKLWKKLSPYIAPNKKKAKLIFSLILNNTTLNTDLHLTTSFCNYFSTFTKAFTFVPLKNASNMCIHL